MRSRETEREENKGKQMRKRPYREFRIEAVIRKAGGEKKIMKKWTADEAYTNLQKVMEDMISELLKKYREVGPPTRMDIGDWVYAVYGK